MIFSLSNLLVLLIAACGGPLEGTPGNVTSLPPPPEQEHAVLPMRGDPEFSTNSMTPNERYWYERLWSALEHEDEEASQDAASGDLYVYGRTLNLHLTDLMTAFRATGDLRLLDEVDRLAQRMRSQLRSTWMDDSGNEEVPDDGTEGLDRWLYFYGHNEWRGKDTHVMDDGLTHSLIAAIAHAFAVNRDTPSPHGVDYAERADFWLDYLVNDFEAKWRIRHDNPEGTWPILDDDRPSPLAHTTVHWIRYHVYLYQLTGDYGYLKEAQRLRDHVLAGLVTLDTPLGEAFAWDHWSIDGSWGAQPTNYARYTIQGVHDLYLEGFFGDPQGDMMQRFATGIAHFVLDNGTEDMAPDVCGGSDCGGIESRSHDRPSMHFFRPFAILMAYDASGEINAVAEEMYLELGPRFPEIPVAKVFELSSGLGLSAPVERIPKSDQ